MTAILIASNSFTRPTTAGSGNPEIDCNLDRNCIRLQSKPTIGRPVGLVNSGLVTIPAVLEGESTVYLAFRYSAAAELKLPLKYGTIDNILGPI